MMQNCQKTGITDEFKRAYYYLHTNGDLIYKNPFVVETNMTPEDYFESDFVVKYWLVENIDQLNNMIIEVEAIANAHKIMLLPGALKKIEEIRNYKYA